MSLIVIMKISIIYLAMKRLNFLLFCGLALSALSCSGVKNDEGKSLKRELTEKQLLAMQLSDSAAIRLSKGLNDSITVSLFDRAIAIDSTVMMRYGMKVKVLNEMGLKNEGLAVFNHLEERNMFQDEPINVMGHGIQYAILGDTVLAREKWTKALGIFEALFDKSPERYMVLNMAVLKRFLDGKEAGREYLMKICKEYPAENEVGKKELEGFISVYDEMPDKIDF